MSQVLAGDCSVAYKLWEAWLIAPSCIFKAVQMLGLTAFLHFGPVANSGDIKHLLGLGLYSLLILA